MNRRSVGKMSRRGAIGMLSAIPVALASDSRAYAAAYPGPVDRDPRWETAIRNGLDYLVRNQSSRGQWNTPPYPTAIAALAATAMLCSGSTATQGPYAKAISRAADFLLSKSRDNGLIGEPVADIRYTYGHGFSMLFLSQVLGEEGFLERRKELVEALRKAVQFCGQAQTPSGGWGYVSARDGNDYDEGSTTITQVQGLRGCRNAGIPVPSQIIEAAKKYIYSCQNPDGGISYSSKQMGTSRPAITAASLATLYNAGDYDSKHVPEMLAYAKQKLHDINNESETFGHWHYTYLYYSQVVYRQGDTEWLPFRDRLYNKIANEQKPDGSWDGQINPVYVTACNLIMLQLDRGYLPIFQR
ncbi:MAG: prenyltransferase/squalene oxidase repeat-containing protein [Pirellulaceae bacterium]